LDGTFDTPRFTIITASKNTLSDSTSIANSQFPFRDRGFGLMG
jgi:hypothetical protein